MHLANNKVNFNQYIFWVKLFNFIVLVKLLTPIKIIALTTYYILLIVLQFISIYEYGLIIIFQIIFSKKNK